MIVSKHSKLTLLNFHRQ